MGVPYVKAAARQRKPWWGCQIRPAEGPGSRTIHASLARRNRAARLPTVRQAAVRRVASGDDFNVELQARQRLVVPAVQPEPPIRGAVACGVAAVAGGGAALVGFLLGRLPLTPAAQDVAALAVACLLGVVFALSLRLVGLARARDVGARATGGHAPPLSP
jgi:hypothetical protein